MLLRRAFRVGLGMVVASWALVSVMAQDDTQAKIENAMSAAPLTIAQDATILDWEFDSDGKLIVLREGTNGWTCLPDDPGTPINNPICLDTVFMEWFYAFISGAEPNVTAPGFVYTLQGEQVWSNSDPFATEPAEDQWHSTAPYMSIVLPASVDLSGYTTDHHSAGPFVMFDGTPYQHIMVPVGDAADQPGVLLPDPVVERIEPADAHAMAQNESVLFVDVRSQPEYERSHIAGALSIPESDLAARIGELPKDQWIITYCT